jgi:hypothetical protein
MYPKLLSKINKRAADNNTGNDTHHMLQNAQIIKGSLAGSGARKRTDTDNFLSR